jgi:hypothetical protein
MSKSPNRLKTVTQTAVRGFPTAQYAAFALSLLLGVALSAFLLATPAHATEPVSPDLSVPSGQVTLPLDEYQRLLQQAGSVTLPPPSSYAIGQSELNIVFQQRDGRMAATVQLTLEVETFAHDWTLVALLSPGAALESARVNGEPVQLVQRAEGLFWLAEERQNATLQLTYHVDSRFSDLAYITSLPIPRAAATRFTLQIPQTHIDLAVAPSSNLQTIESDNSTTASGTLPGATSIMVSWRVAAEREYVLSKAAYTGTIRYSSQLPRRESAIEWLASIDAEMLSDGEVIVPLVSTATTLVSVLVNDQEATVFNQDGHFAVRLSGAGRHRIDLRFLSAVNYPDGVPSSGFDIPDVPVSRFELNLDGDKLVQASPVAGAPASVNISHRDGATVASFFIPMSSHLDLSWMEAIPEDPGVERRANAEIYHAFHAAEGVLYGIASIRYDITRGEAKLLEFSLPASAQVNHITSSTQAIADWIMLEPNPEKPSGETVIRVFLNRAISGEFTLDIAFEQLLEDAVHQAGAISVPILRAQGVARQKGMIALLSGQDLALAPEQQSEMSEVGENQLPAFFRNQLQQVVSHTYKYHSATAALSVDTVTPERRQGKFNAQVDTLISIGEVTLRGQVSIESDVKSGVLRDLSLELPADVNILGVTGPSIRNHSIVTEGDVQRLDIQFTREMDGQFRVELNYERIMLDGAAETTVPRVEVLDADVEHGRIAIEALSALEVQASLVEQLSSLEINELPRQLVLKTTNPILLAYRYVRTENPFQLQLRITRHEEIDVQLAAIDSASYTSLFTTDGLLVTRVQFDVRNSRRQFLRLGLPADSEIWSVFVNDSAQKPAFASDTTNGSQDVLIKMINSSTAFSVELVYATRSPAMRTFGSIRSSLPRPDMIVTHSSWDVYVPAALSYGKADTNMELLMAGVPASVKGASAELLHRTPSDLVSGEPLHIELPTQGLRYQFAKLYANQSAQEAWFSLNYVHPNATFIGWWSSLLAVLAVWLGIVLLGMRKMQSQGRIPPHLSWALIVAGTLALMASIRWLGASTIAPSLLSLAIAVALSCWQLWVWWRKSRN